MNWEHLADGSVIVFCAGSLVALVRGWTVISKGLADLREAFSKCQEERDVCRKSIQNHHESRLIHIDPERDEKAWELLIEKIDRNHAMALENHRLFCIRMDRLEAVLLKINGSTKA